MIIITGSITARADTFEELQALSLAHTHRSRTEDGCLLHSVHVDVENKLKLVFVEHWRDRSAVLKHFALSGSRAFSKAAARLAASPPKIAIFDASKIPLGSFLAGS